MRASLIPFLFFKRLYFCRVFSSESQLAGLEWYAFLTSKANWVTLSVAIIIMLGGILREHEGFQDSYCHFGFICLPLAKTAGHRPALVIFTNLHLRRRQPTEFCYEAAPQADLKERSGLFTPHRLGTVAVVKA
jgi:hypothetical protein